MNDYKQAAAAEREELLSRRADIDRRLAQLDVFLAVLPSLDARMTSGDTAQTVQQASPTWQEPSRPVAQADARSHVSAVVSAAKAALDEFAAPMKIWPLVEAIERRGVVLTNQGDEDVDRRKRVASILNRMPEFTYDAASGWMLKSHASASA